MKTTSPLTCLKATIAAHCGKRPARGELWLGSELFNKEGLSDTIENHFRLTDRLGHDIISLSVSDDPRSKPDFGYRYFECMDIRQAVKQYDLPVFAVVDGPFQEMVSKTGLMEVLTEWARDKKEFSDAYRKLSQKTMKLITKLLEHQVSAVVIADDFAFDSGPMVSPSDIDLLFSPFYKQFVQTVNNANVAAFFHSCGNLSQLIPIIKTWEIDGFSAIQTTTNDLVNIYQQFDTKIMIMAGIELEMLETAPLATGALKQLEPVIETIGRPGNLIISTSSGLYKNKYLERIKNIYTAVDDIYTS